jgi:hypothetical protein
MKPVLRSGDWIGVHWHEPLARSGATPRTGDVLLGRAPGEVWVVHRMVHADAGGFVLKGDASTMTERLTSEEIWGRVVAIRRKGDQREVPFRSNVIDGWIARLSRLRLRRTVYVLGWIRRALLG